MERKNPIFKGQTGCTKASDSVRKLEKQYEQLCRLREQVQIAESRQRVSLRDMSQDPASLKRRRSQDNPH